MTVLLHARQTPTHTHLHSPPYAPSIILLSYLRVHMWVTNVVLHECHTRTMIRGCAPVYVYLRALFVWDIVGAHLNVRICTGRAGCSTFICVHLCNRVCMRHTYKVTFLIAHLCIHTFGVRVHLYGCTCTQCACRNTFMSVARVHVHKRVRGYLRACAPCVCILVREHLCMCTHMWLAC